MYYTVIKHDGHLRTRGKCRKHERRRVFSTFLECSQMTGVFYHSVIHGLGFFICFKIEILRAQNNKTRFFYVLYSDKTRVFDQSERAQGPIYILKYYSKADRQLESRKWSTRDSLNFLTLKHQINIKDNYSICGNWVFNLIICLIFVSSPAGLISYCYF